MNLSFGVAAGLLVMSALALREGRKFARWAHLYTLECAAWIPDVDGRLASPEPGARDPDR